MNYMVYLRMSCSITMSGTISFPPRLILREAKYYLGLKKSLKSLNVIKVIKNNKKQRY